MNISIILFLLAAIYPNVPNKCDQDIYYLNGQINRSASEDFHHFLSTCGAPKKLLVRSGGGDSHAAIEIAEGIVTYNLDVEVDSICLSACALFIALAANRLFLDVNDAIGFHHSQYGLKRFFDAAYSDANLDWERLNNGAAVELSFFERHDLDTAWLTKPMEIIGIRCVFLGRDKDGATPNYKAQRHMWIPSHDAFDNAVVVEGEGNGKQRILERYKVLRGGTLSSTVVVSRSSLDLVDRIEKCDP